MKFGTDVHGALWMNPNDLVDSLTYFLVPSAGQNFHLSSKIS